MIYVPFATAECSNRNRYLRHEYLEFQAVRWQLHVSLVSLKPGSIDLKSRRARGAGRQSRPEKCWPIQDIADMLSHISCVRLLSCGLRQHAHDTHTNLVIITTTNIETWVERVKTYNQWLKSSKCTFTRRVFLSLQLFFRLALFLLRCYGDKVEEPPVQLSS